MSNYNSDRAFTDFVHAHIAVPEIYEKMGWFPSSKHDSYHDERDKKDGVDYQATDHLGMKVTIQERFRDAYFADKYNDFTIRYTREHSLRTNEKQSEFFKINADYFIYGITNGKKYADARHTVTGFIKYVVLDVNALKNLLRHGIIRIPDTFQRYSKIDFIEGKKVLYTAKVANPDRSSEFIAIDPSMLKDLLGESLSNIVVDQFGFY